MAKSQVSAPQFFSLLYLSMLGSVFMYISSTNVTIASAESLLRPVAFAFVSIIVAIPIYFVCKNRCLADYNKTKAYKIIAFFYAVVYFADALMTIGRFDLFASSELFPGTEMTYFLIGLVAVCVGLSFYGLGALGRAGIIFTSIVVGATAFAAMTLSRDVDLLNFSPLLENGLNQFVYDSLLFVIQGSEIGMLVLFFPQIKGNVKKHYLWWAVLSAASFSFVLFFVVGTLGVFADTQLFPTYAAISLAGFGLFERLDALETAIWILCVVGKLTLYIIAITKCVCFAFSKFTQKLTSVCVGVLVGLIPVLISGNIKGFSFISSLPLIIAVYLIPVVVLPMALLLFDYIKRRKLNEKAL